MPSHKSNDYKVKKEYVKLLVDEINKNKTITLHELNQKLKDKYKDANLSTTQIFIVINDNNITLKLTRIRHEPVKRFGKDIKSLQKRNRCYSNKGKRCVIKTQSQEVFKKYTGVFAISVNGVVN